MVVTTVMGGFKVYQDNYADFTIVSNRFIDEYMEDANDAQLKVYLYLIRMLNADLPTGICDIADRFNYTEKDVHRALRYWEKKHLITLEYDSNKSLVGVCMLPIGATVVAHPTLKAVQEPVVSAVIESAPAQKTFTALQPSVSENITGEGINAAASEGDIPDKFAKPTYSKDDLKGFKTRESSSQLVFIAEQYLHKTLSVAELGSLLYISDTLKFSDDLIDYLLQYCVGREKTDYRYMEAVALDWAQSGITTPRQAANHARKYDKIVYDIMKALGKSSSPSNVEVSLINKWTKDYAFDMTVIAEACERTVLNTDKKRFRYADTILTHWYDIGVRKKADIDNLDPPRRKHASPDTGSANTSRNRFNQFSQNTYDYDSLEKEYLSN